MIADDLAGLFGGGDAPGVSFRQGTIVAWNQTTGANLITVAGTTLQNIALLGVTAAAIHTGDHVGLLTVGASWFILGKITDPGDSAIPTWTTDIAAAQAAAAAAGTAAGTATAAKLDLLVALNSSPLTIGGGLITLDTINVSVAAGGVANSVFALELDATATGTGTVTVTFFYGSAQVGPTVRVAFVAGPVHIPVNDFLIGLSTSAAFTARAQVTTGTGTIAVPADGAHMYVLGTSLADGGSGTSPAVTVGETVTYDSSVTDAVDASPSSPLAVTPTETVDTTPSTTTETVTAVTTP